jgi:glycosyltransferase involved in cell wall biosynthesis
MNVWLLQRNEPTPHDDGGSSRDFRTGLMAQFFVRAGHNVTWWTSDFNHYSKKHRHKRNIKRIVNKGYFIQYLKASGYKNNLSLMRIVSNQSVANSFQLISKDVLNKPDLIIASLPTAELAAEGIKYATKNNVPIFIDIRDLWPDYFVSLTPIWFRPFLKLATIPLLMKTRNVLSQANGVLALTNEFLNWGLKLGNRGKTEYDFVIPMGYVKKPKLKKINFFAEDKFWDDLGIYKANEGIVVIFAGTIGYSSDFSIIIEAAKVLLNRNEKIQFVICGEGEKLQSLKKSVKNLKNIFTPGWVNNRKLTSLLKRSDIGLLPYINNDNYIKNIPNKPAEYLSEGLVLANSLSEGNIVSLINEFDCGFSYNENTNILIERLTYLSKNSKELEKMKRNSFRAFSKRLDGDLIYRDMVSYFELIINSEDLKN